MYQFIKLFSPVIGNEVNTRGPVQTVVTVYLTLVQILITVSALPPRGANTPEGEGHVNAHSIITDIRILSTFVDIHTLPVASFLLETPHTLTLE